MSVITPPDDEAVDVADAEQQSLIKRITSLQSVWILGVLVVIVAFFSVIAGDRFFSSSNFSLISQNVAVWAVLGVGMTFVIITSGIDLSIGSVLVFSSVVAAQVMQSIGGDGWGTASICAPSGITPPSGPRFVSNRSGPNCGGTPCSFVHFRMLRTRGIRQHMLAPRKSWPIRN